MSTGGIKYFPDTHFDPITFEELKKQVKGWNKEKDMQDGDLVKLRNIVDNNYDKDEYLTLEDIEKIENIDKTNILKSLKKNKIKIQKVYSQGTRPIIIIHKNDIEEYLKNKYRIQ